MTASTSSDTLDGVPASLYTGKARSYLRTQDIDFVEVAPGMERYLKHIVPLNLCTVRRVERQGHVEVWGALE